jgi:hypothetical protein
MRSKLHRWPAALGLLAGSLCSAQIVLQPIGPDPRSGFQPIGRPISVETTEFVNPVYLMIHFRAAELRNVDSIGIVDRTARREVHRFTRAEFGPQIEALAPDTPVTFAKNLIFRRPEKRSRRVIMVTAFNANGRPIRSSAFEFDVEPHPSETLTAEVSFQTFFDIAQIDFKDVCRPQARSFKATAGVLIGEQEQTFPSLARLTAIQVRESLRGYFEGCLDAYQKCLGAGAGAQGDRIQRFCNDQREKLRRDVFSGN